jgi:hypothetical protein
VLSLRLFAPVNARSLAASAIYVVLGGLIFLFGWNDERSMLETAVLGAAFPSIFAALLRAKEAEYSTKTTKGPLAGRGRDLSLWDYLTSRVD